MLIIIQDVSVLITTFKLIEWRLGRKKGESTRDTALAKARLHPQTKQSLNGRWTATTHYRFSLSYSATQHSKQGGEEE
jgi:hypothetical protein